jgi:hypothetical protein
MFISCFGIKFVARFGELAGFEPHSLPALARCFPLSFAFYVAHPIRSILFYLSTLLR